MKTISSKKNQRILLGQDNNALVLLFAANMLMFAGIHILSIIYQLSDTPMDLFYQQILNRLTLPASFDGVASRPWTMLLYMFTHYGFWHLVSSMLWLWCFGYILQDLAGNSKLIPIYLYGGITGALFFLLGNNLLPGMEKNLASAAPMMGASASVMAVAIGTTTLAPDYRIFPMIGGGIPLWVVAIIFVAIDFSTIGTGNTAIAAAHLSAGLLGFVFIRQLKRGSDWSAWMIQLVNWLDGLFNPEKKQGRLPAKEKQFYRSDRQPFNKKPNVTQQKLDAILDKINQHGYEYLSREEKEFLERASKEEL